MADTIPDIILTGEEYQSVNTETGITVGTSVRIQNKSIRNAILVKSSSKPDKTTRGYLIKPDARFTIDIASGEPELWLLGEGPIGIEEI